MTTIRRTFSDLCMIVGVVAALAGALLYTPTAAADPAVPISCWCLGKPGGAECGGPAPCTRTTTCPVTNCYCNALGNCEVVP